MSDKSDNNKPIIGITIGDINGIGPEIIINAMSDDRMLSLFTPVIYGSSKIISYYRKGLNIQSFSFNQIRSLDQLNPRKINVLNCWDEHVNVEMGEVTENGGKYAYLALKQATSDLKYGKIHAMVTAPINKANIQSDEFKFKGHTDFLAESFETKNVLMFMVSEDIKVGLVTDHVPILDVPQLIKKELIVQKLQIMNRSLINDFKISKPKIAILGLNPHAGENGLIGKEEQEEIIPAITQAKEKGHLVFGPFSADGFFGDMQFKRYDAVLAMYHDQGLIPFKSFSFGEGVNFTAGIPAIRTSPDHGTAYSLSGKKMANPGSMRQALYLAADLAIKKFE